MSVEDMVLDTLRHLPPEKQQEVLDFARSLAEPAPAKTPLRGVEGEFAHLNVNITAEDIDEARREMWGNFPREDITP